MTKAFKTNYCESNWNVHNMIRINQNSETGERFNYDHTIMRAQFYSNEAYQLTTHYLNHNFKELEEELNNTDIEVFKMFLSAFTDPKYVLLNLSNRYKDNIGIAILCQRTKLEAI